MRLCVKKWAMSWKPHFSTGLCFGSPRAAACFSSRQRVGGSGLHRLKRGSGRSAESSSRRVDQKHAPRGADWTVAWQRSSDRRSFPPIGEACIGHSAHTLVALLISHAASIIKACSSQNACTVPKHLAVRAYGRPSRQLDHSP